MDFIDLPMGCLMLSSTLFIYNKTPWCVFFFSCFYLFFFWIAQAGWGTPVSYIKRWAESRTSSFSSDQQRQVAQRAGRWVWEAQQRNIPAVFLHFFGLPSGKRHDQKFFPFAFQIHHTRNERTPLFVFFESQGTLSKFAVCVEARVLAALLPLPGGEAGGHQVTLGLTCGKQHWPWLKAQIFVGTCSKSRPSASIIYIIFAYHESVRFFLWIRSTETSNAEKRCGKISAEPWQFEGIVSPRVSLSCWLVSWRPSACHKGVFFVFIGFRMDLLLQFNLQGYALLSGWQRLTPCNMPSSPRCWMGVWLDCRQRFHQKKEWTNWMYPDTWFKGEYSIISIMFFFKD